MQRTAWLVTAAAMAWLALASPPNGWAQPKAETAPAGIPDEAARKMLELGLRNIDRAVCDGFNPCVATTPDELEFPPINLNQVRAAMVTGTRSAFARWCGLDADARSIAPMMRQLRTVARFNNRQVALVAVIHSIQLNVISEQLTARGSCDDATRRKLDAELPKK